jgi:hypothetical protein
VQHTPNKAFGPVINAAKEMLGFVAGETAGMGLPPLTVGESNQPSHTELVIL